MLKDKTKFEPGSVDLFKENIDKLKELFPQVVTDGEIDFEMLKSILDKNLADSKEKYQFTWNGKSRTIKLAQSPSNATLLPSIKDSKNWDTTENLYIEGDNLEVLKLLQKTYFNKIKMIYIDPPYNTGGDFVYKDDFKDTIKNYKEQTEQTTRVNPETSGRYHTDWLNMMYSRLMLAKNLLSDDGAIFVSIDENEVENLKKIMNEIYGENNFIAQFTRLTKKGGKSTDKIAKNNDYVMVFSKNYKLIEIKRIAHNDSGFKFKDEYFDERGLFKLNQTLDYNSLQYSKTMDYPIQVEGRVYYPGSSEDLFNQRQNGNHKRIDWVWRWSKAKVQAGLKLGFIKIQTSNKENSRIYTKTYQNATLDKINDEYVVVYTERTKPISSIDLVDNKYSNDRSNNELKNLLGDTYFEYVKPIELIRFITAYFTENDSIILDFFSGSATTAHAVMQLNAEDGGNRKFIMVQLPEKTTEDSEAYKAGYKNICEIGKERIRRAGELVKKDLIEKNTKLDKDEEKVDPSKLDIGFKVFKLEESNFKEWDSSKEPTIEQLELFADPIKEGKSEEDVLYEVLLKYGVFDQEVKKLKINNKDIYSVSDNYLIVMLSNKITPEDVEEIKKLKPKIVIFRDSGFNGNDTIKINAFYTLTKSGVEEVKSV